MKEIIGIHEIVSLPKVELKDIVAKTDTGAYNSAIGCSYAQEVMDSQGVLRLEYILLSAKRKGYTGKKYRTKNFKKKVVRSSNGTETSRYQVKLKVQVKNKVYRTTFNLSHRSAMRYPVLLGRKFLANRFLVDVNMNRKVKKDIT